MAQNKKSFLLYCDLIHVTNKLTDEEAGKLLKHILDYVNDKNPEPESRFIDIIFEPIKRSLKRDLQKYEGIRQKNKENALKRWNKKECHRIQPLTKNADSDNDSDNDINKIKERENKFHDLLFTYNYPKTMLEDFYSYWTEKGIKDKKMRFEKEKSFDIKRRLQRWYNRNPRQYENIENNDLLNYVKNQIKQ